MSRAEAVGWCTAWLVSAATTTFVYQTWWLLPVEIGFASYYGMRAIRSEP